MAVVTNGASCLQREKLAASGLEERFDAVVVSGELGVGKPDAAMFRHALAAGLGAVWINRFGAPGGRDGVPGIASLAELRGALTRRSPRCP
jgi:hypothetical protein